MTQPNKPTILICIDHYLPGYRAGGPIRTISNFVEWLGDEFNFRILTKDRDLGDQVAYANIEPDTWYQVGKAQVRYLSPNEQQFHAVTSLLAELKYDLLYLNSVFSNFTVFSLLFFHLNRISRKTTLLAPRGNLSKDAMSIKSPKKRLYLVPAKILDLYSYCYWHAASDHEALDILRVLGAHHKSRIHVIPNLPTPIKQFGNVRVSRKLSGEARIVFLSRISKMKNLDFFLRTLHKVNGKIYVDIWGPIEDNTYWEYCQGVFKSLPSNIKIAYKGDVAPDKIISTLSGYHLFYLPTLGENFGHVILEALCAGCPVLISNRTPWNDLQENGVGWSLPLEDPEYFPLILQQIIDADEQTVQGMAERAQRYGLSYISNSGAITQMSNYLKSLIAP